MFSQVINFCFFVYLIHRSVSVIVCPTFKDYFSYRTNKKCFDNPDGDAAKPSDIIQRHGFNSKTYHITTRDGYILSVERLNDEYYRKTPVIIGPGIYMNSLAFINRGNKSIAFFLAKNGYQVWIINWRGTRFSRQHTHLSARDNIYWNTGFHQMATSDLKAVLQKVHQETGNKGIYVGFSMGTTIGLTFNIKEQEVAENTLKGMVHLAPVAKLDNSRSILKFLNPFWPLVRPLLSGFTNGEILPYKRKRVLCGSHPFQVVLCEMLILPIFGNSFKFLDPLTYPVTSIQNRDSISIATVEHYHQIIKSGSFQEFHYGREGNLEKYNMDEPPLYDLGRVTLPQVLLVGGRDILATQKDTRYLYDHLPEESKCGYVLLEEYGHRDFINDKNVENVLFDKLLTSVDHIDEGNCDVNIKK